MKGSKKQRVGPRKSGGKVTRMKWDEEIEERERDKKKKKKKKEGGERRKGGGGGGYKSDDDVAKRVRKSKIVREGEREGEGGRRTRRGRKEVRGEEDGGSVERNESFEGGEGKGPGGMASPKAFLSEKDVPFYSNFEDMLLTSDDLHVKKFSDSADIRKMPPSSSKKGLKRMSEMDIKKMTAEVEVRRGLDFASDVKKGSDTPEGKKNSGGDPFGTSPKRPRSSTGGLLMKKRDKLIDKGEGGGGGKKGGKGGKKGSEMGAGGEEEEGEKRGSGRGGRTNRGNKTPVLESRDRLVVI